MTSTVTSSTSEPSIVIPILVPGRTFSFILKVKLDIVGGLLTSMTVTHVSVFSLVSLGPGAIPLSVTLDCMQTVTSSAAKRLPAALNLLRLRFKVSVNSESMLRVVQRRPSAATLKPVSSASLSSAQAPLIIMSHSKLENVSSCSFVMS